MAVVTLAVLFRPPRIRVYLTAAGRLVRPCLGSLAIVDLLLIVTAVALDRERDNRRIHDRDARSLVAWGFQASVEFLEQGLDPTRP